MIKKKKNICELCKENINSEKEKRYRTLIEGIKGSFIYSHDTKGVFKYISPSIKNVLGYTPKQFLKHYTTYLTNNPVNKEVQNHTNMSIKGIEQKPYIIEIFHKNKSKIWLEVKEIPIKDKNGKVIAVEGVAHDVTKDIKLKKEMSLANEELKKASELKSVVLRDISHKLRNPAVISVMASESLIEELNQEKLNKNKIKKYLKIINKNAKQFNYDIDSLLKLSELQNTQKIDKKNVNLKKIVLQVIKENQDLIDEKNIKFKFCGKHEYALCNKNLIKSLFYNLINNSIKYSNNNYITFACKINKKNKKIYISIEDKGIGFRKKDLKNVFKAFSNPDPSSKGLGIGLSICKKIVDLHNGEISIESKYKKGTKITFSLPLGCKYEKKNTCN